MVRLVRLKGTWSRTNTERWEVDQYRRYMRHRLQRQGGWFDAKCPRTQPDDGSMTGTFDVSIPVTNLSRDRGQSVRAAKKLFEAYMAIEMCRPPKVKYRNDLTFVSTDWSTLAPEPVIK
jgi:hypothetical protein